MKLIIGNKNYSSWSMRPWILLRHFGVSFEEIRIPLFVDGFKERISQYSAAGTVPILQTTKGVIWDSLAICEFVNEEYLESRAWPADAFLRAQARSASAEMHSGFFAIRNNLPMNCRASGRRVELSETILAEVYRVDQLWQELISQYANPKGFLFGELSIADCMFAPMVSRFHTYGVEVSLTSRRYMETVLALPAVSDWYKQAEIEKEVIDFAEQG